MHDDSAQRGGDNLEEEANKNLKIDHIQKNYERLLEI